jgi:hypothetical protein
MTGDLILVVWVSGGPVGYVMTHCAQDTRWDDSGGVLGAQVGVGWTLGSGMAWERSWGLYETRPDQGPTATIPNPIASGWETVIA